jgi:large subunit ribosomal protein L6
VHPAITVQVDKATNAVVVTRPSDVKAHKELHGLTRSLIAGMVKGVVEGYVRRLLVVGVGYTAKLDGQTLVLQVGYSNPIRVPIPLGIKVEPPQQTTVPISGVGPTAGFLVSVNGVDKELVGKFAAGLRAVRPPEPYKGKGIRYENEYVKIKPGKAFVSGE